VLAGEGVECLFVYGILVAVPPSHTAGIRAELLLPAMLGLLHRFSALPANLGVWDYRMAVDIGTDSSGWDIQRCGNLRRGMPL